MSLQILVCSLLFAATYSAGASEGPPKETVTTVKGYEINKFLISRGALSPYVQKEVHQILEAEFDSLTGFAALIANSVVTTGASLPSGTNTKCAKARAIREQWYAEHGRPVPTAGFGKIIKYEMTPEVRDGGVKHWTGELELCSWFSSARYDDEYYFVMKLVGDGFEQKKKNADGTFPGVDLGTLEGGPDELMDAMEGFSYKLHATGASIQFQVAQRNGQDILSEFVNDDTNCLDIFFVDEPTADLPEQMSYCMGRCDFQLINTGRCGCGQDHGN